MIQETPGQRCVRECRHVFIVETALDGRASQLGACAACIDAAIDARTELMEAEARHAALVLVRRERAEVIETCIDVIRDRGVHWHDAMPDDRPDLMPALNEIVAALRARAAQEETND